MKYILDRYKDYDICYSSRYNTLIIYKPIPVKDFVNIRNIIKAYDLDVDEIRVVGRCS